MKFAKTKLDIFAVIKFPTFSETLLTNLQNGNV